LQKTFTDSKEYGVSAEELKSSWKRKDYKLDRSSLSLQRLLPQNHCENTPKNAVLQKDTFIYHDVLAKETKYLL
jgi:hypothetical protein